VEVTSEDEQLRRLEEPDYPEVVGTTEVLKLLDIPRQRLHELRSVGRFPAPLLELAATPVWLKSAITAFDSMRERRPGRSLQWFDRVFKDGESVTAVLAQRHDHDQVATIGISRKDHEDHPETFIGRFEDARAVALALGMADPPEFLSNGSVRWTRS
jgi:hypothetical protein